MVAITRQLQWYHAGLWLLSHAPSRLRTALPGALLGLFCPRSDLVVALELSPFALWQL